MSNDIEFATVDISEIEVEDGRARTDFGDIVELAASIKSTGLIQPLAVYRKDNGKFGLIAGERRLRAKTHNGDTKTPVRIFPAGLSKLELRTIELHENFYRKDFSWLELVNLQREIHDLQQEIHGKKVSTLPDAPGWSMADTASLVNRSKSSVAQDIQLAEAVQQFPELFGACKNKNEATKLMNKISESLIRDELSKRVTESKGSDSIRRLANAYVVGSFFDVAKGMDKELFNLIEIDPPYAIELTDVKKQESTANTKYDLKDYEEISPDDYPLFMRTMFKESFRLATTHAWMIVWFAPEPWLEQMYNWITEAGWKTSRMVGIWTKGQGQTMNPNTKLANSYEMFFYCWKGQPALAKPGSTNDFRYASTPPQRKIHPTQRPIELMVDLYSTFAFEGSRVLIPCAGSGSGIIAADSCKMSAIATDINPAYKDSYVLMLNDYLNGN